MEYLRITFKIGTEIRSPNHPLHLDNLIARLRVDENERNKACSPQETWPCLEEVLADLPFGKVVGADGEWVWQASQLHWTFVGSSFISFQTRKFEFWKWQELRDNGTFKMRRQVEKGSGEEKSYVFYNQMRNATTATAWCYGDRDLIQTLIAGADPLHLGKERRLVRGLVTSFTVEPAPEAEKEFWRRRALPLSLEHLALPGHAKLEATVRPPYWDRANKRLALVYREPFVAPELRLNPPSDSLTPETAKI